MSKMRFVIAGPLAVVADPLMLRLSCCVKREAVAARWAFLGSSVAYVVIWFYSVYCWVTLLSAAPAADDQPTLISARSGTVVVHDAE